MEEFNRDKYKEAGYSNDVLPTESSDKNWNITNYFSVWMGSVHNIPNYLAIGGLFALGLSVGQVFSAIMSAAIIISAIMVLNGHAGSKYGLPFSMQVRTAFGIRGSIIPGVIRGVIAAILWFGLQTFAGSQALFILIAKIWPGFAQLGGDWDFLGLSLPGLIAFIVFWLFNVTLIFGGMDLLGRFTKYLSPLVYVVFGGMAIWAVNLAGGIGPILNYTAEGIEGNTIIVFLGAIVAVIAAWAAPMVNVSDFTKLARSTKDQTLGQSIGLIVAYLLFAIASIAIIVGSEIAFGTPIWNVLNVIDRFDSSFAVGLSVLTLCLTALAVNVTGNIVPAGYQLASLFPTKLNFKSGAMAAAVIGVLILPWKLMEDPTSILAFLNTVSGLLAPITGIMLAHYYVIAKRKIDLNELFSKQGKYHYRNGFNYNAIITLILSSALSLIGNFVSFLEPLYTISWFVGIISAFIIYLLLERDKGTGPSSQSGF